MPRITAEAVVNNINGFHVRPSTAIAREASVFECSVHLFKSNSEIPIDAKSSLDMISSFIVKGDRLRIECDGKDAEKAMPVIKAAVEAVYDFQDPHPVRS